MKPMLAIVAALSLAACSSSPQILSGTPENVTYAVRSDQVPQANEAAAKFCGSFGKAARLDHVANERGQVVASYDCG